MAVYVDDFSEFFTRIPTDFRNGYRLRQPFECLQRERLGLVDLCLLVIRPAYADSNDRIFGKYIERPTESVSAPECFLANTIDLLRRHSIFFFLPLCPAMLFALLVGLLLIRCVSCEPTQPIGPESLRVGWGGILRIMFDDCEANRHIGLLRIVIALRHQHPGARSSTVLGISNCSVLDRTNLFVRDEAARCNSWLR